LVCAGEDEDLANVDFQEQEEDIDKEDETSDETDDPTRPEVVEKQKRRLRIARLKRKSIAARAYQFVGAGNGVEGIVFMEISKITNLPPEKNGMGHF
jgi:phosphatidylserine decarboxylase